MQRPRVRVRISKEHKFDQHVIQLLLLLSSYLHDKTDPLLGPIKEAPKQVYGGDN